VLSDLRHVAIWGGLDAEGLARLAYRALFFAGRGHTQIDSLIPALYRVYAGRVSDERRGEIFARIRDFAHVGLARSQVLVHFLCRDPEPGIVSTAALDIACLAVAEGPEGVVGADYVLKLTVSGMVLNPGAALGGLLALGDENVNWKLDMLRAALAHPAADGALAQMASCATGYVYATTVDFWLEWMEALAADFPDSRRVFDWAAHALARQREAMVDEIILQGKRIYPIPSSGEIHEPGFREIPLVAFADSIAPRLLALEPLVRESEKFQRVLTAWLGRAPRE
jgi:hypothetical protein